MLLTDHSLAMKKAFEFLKLPAEVRNMIYRNVLVKKRYCYFLFQPPITLVNKQIRSESLPVLYGNNKFMVHFNSGLLAQDPSMWLRSFWVAPDSVPTVSAISNFIYVAKLDIQFCFIDDWSPNSEDVDVCIRMRRGDLTSRSSMKYGIASQRGLKWEDRPILESAYKRLVNDCLQGNQYSVERQLAYGGMHSVITTMLDWAKICPATVVSVWMELETKWRDRRAGKPFS